VLERRQIPFFRLLNVLEVNQLIHRRRKSCQAIGIKLFPGASIITYKPAQLQEQPGSADMIGSHVLDA